MGPKGPRAAQNSPSCESAGKGCAEVAFVRAGFEDGDGRASRFMQTGLQPSGFSRSEYSLHYLSQLEPRKTGSHEGHFCAWEAWRAACRSAAF